MLDFVKIIARIGNLGIARGIEFNTALVGSDFTSRLEFLSRAHELIDELAGFVPLPEYSPLQARVVSIGQPRPKRKQEE